MISVSVRFLLLHEKISPPSDAFEIFAVIGEFGIEGWRFGIWVWGHDLERTVSEKFSHIQVWVKVAPITFSLNNVEVSIIFNFFNHNNSLCVIISLRSLSVVNYLYIYGKC